MSLHHLRFLLILLAAWLVSFSAFARDRAAADAAYTAAKAADASFDFPKALQAFDEAFRADPSAPFARQARARAQWLREHDEGEFQPIIALERVRRDRDALDSVEKIGDFARQVESFAPGRTRVEAWVTIADAYHVRHHRPELAIPALERVLTSSGARPSDRVMAFDRVVECQLQLDDFDAALRSVERWGELSPAVRDRVFLLRSRGRLGTISMAVLTAAFLFGVAAAVMLHKRGLSLAATAGTFVHPYALPFALYVGGVGALCVQSYDATDPQPFLILGAGVVLLAGVARAWHRAVQSSPARYGFGVVGLLAVFAVAFLALSESDPAYLESFGL